MGMFDSINIDVKCPYCEGKSETVQTKDLDCVLQTYNVGDKIGEKHRWLDSCEICDSCNKYYNVRVDVDKYGVITGEYTTHKEDAQ